MANWSKQFKQIDTINSGQEYTLNDYVTLDMVNAPLNNTQYLYDLLFSDGLITFLQNEYAKVDTDGAIVHMSDLEYYGSRPAVFSINCNFNFTYWNSYSSSIAPGGIINPLSLKSGSNNPGAVVLLPVDSYKSVVEAKVEYLSGDSGYIDYELSTVNNYTEFNARNISQKYIYGLGSSSGTLKTTSYRVTISDMYGHSYSLDFTISYKVIN